MEDGSNKEEVISQNKTEGDLSDSENQDGNLEAPEIKKKRFRFSGLGATRTACFSLKPHTVEMIRLNAAMKGISASKYIDLLVNRFCHGEFRKNQQQLDFCEQMKKQDIKGKAREALEMIKSAIANEDNK